MCLFICSWRIHLSSTLPTLRLYRWVKLTQVSQHSKMITPLCRHDQIPELVIVSKSPSTPLVWVWSENFYECWSPGRHQSQTCDLTEMIDLTSPNYTRVMLVGFEHTIFGIQMSLLTREHFQVLTSVSVHVLPIDRTHSRCYEDIAMFVFFTLSHCLGLPQRHRKNSSSNFDLKLYLQTHTDESSLSRKFRTCSWFQL